MYAMAALLVIALVANALVRPVDARHHMESAAGTGTKGASPEGAQPAKA